jgi:hypothetical protein
MLESPYVLELQAVATLKAKHDALKMVLEERFGALPADLLARLGATTEADKLDQLLRAAIRVNRPEELPL